MRFMVLVKANKDSEAGVMPSQQMLTDMMRFNEELVKAGVMLAGEGLHPTAKGARLNFSANGPTVTHGPFPEAGLIAGFWLVKLGSLDEVIARFKRCPMEAGAELEIRQVFEAEDFGESLSPELQEKEERLRQQAAANQPS